MNADATIEKAKAAIEEMRELLAKLEAEKATKARNWPELIEAGMVFRARSGHEKEGDLFVAAEDEEPYLLHAATGRFYNRGKYFWDEFPWERYEYLGMAANGLAWSDPTQACENAADTHEPTGAELVGRVCEFSDSPTGPWSPGLCAAFGHNPTYQYRKAGGAEWRYARLAK